MVSRAYSSVLVGALMALACQTVLADAPARQATLTLSAPAYERTDAVRATLQLPEPIAANDATVAYEVRDSFGRLLVRTSEPLAATETSPASVSIQIEVPNVVVMRHHLGVSVRDAKGQTYFGQASFVFKPPAGWDEYQPFIYQKHPPHRLGFIRDAYVTNNLWYGSNPSVPEYMVDANFRWYVENVSVPVLAPYHRWHEDHIGDVEYLFKRARSRFNADRSLLNLQRTPCLSQETTLELLERCAMFPARNMAAYRPVWYSLTDEPGIGGQAAESGFCFSPECREAFVAWLGKRYPSLEALNSEWGTDYKDWRDVRGWTPDEIFARQTDNFAPWCDHTDFMDDVLMNAYAVGMKKIQEFDPGAYVGLGGGQGPVAVGGWDYWKITQTLNCAEPYYIASNWELMRSFNPDFRVVSITGGGDTMSKHHRWFGFVHNDYGSLMWDNDMTFVDDDGKYDQQGTESAKWHKELTGGLARQYLPAPRIDDPIAIYESQAAMRVHWVLHVRQYGQKWTDRRSYHERTDNPFGRVREAWVKLVEDAGLQYKMLAPQQVVADGLQFYDPQTHKGFKLLILPRVVALSADEAEAIRRFVQAGGTVIADAMPGLFDEHGKRLPAGRLDELFGVSRSADQPITMIGDVASGVGDFKLLEPMLQVGEGKPMQPDAPLAMVQREVGKGRTCYMNLDIIDYHRWRLHPGEEATTRDLMNPILYQALGKDRRTPRFAATDGTVPTGLEVTVKDLGQVRIVALQRNPQLMISELGPMEYQSNEGFEKPIEVNLDVNLPGERRTFFYRDMRTGEQLDEGETVRLTVIPFEPRILSVWPNDPGEFTCHAPASIQRGQPLNIAVTPGSTQAKEFVYNLEATGPDGKQRMLYRSNHALDGRGGQITVPLAVNDPPGEWTFAIREALTGATKTVSVQVD